MFILEFYERAGVEQEAEKNLKDSFYDIANKRIPEIQKGSKKISELVEAYRKKTQPKIESNNHSVASSRPVPVRIERVNNNEGNFVASAVVYFKEKYNLVNFCS